MTVPVLLAKALFVSLFEMIAYKMALYRKIKLKLALHFPFYTELVIFMANTS